MTTPSNAKWVGPDLYVIVIMSLLLVWGLVSMTSASYFMAAYKLGSGWFYFFKHLSHIAIAMTVGFGVYLLPVDFWYRFSPLVFVGVLLLLVAVLVPGIGKTVNGAARWLPVMGVNVQVSEFAKWALILYLSGYIHRRQYDIQHSIKGVIIPLALIAFTGFLVILEPDFGALFVMLAIGSSMLFFAGIAWRYVFAVLAFAVTALAGLAVSAPYRLARLTAFFDPWANPYGEGYQLTQSLMAVARGGTWGVGLGQGLQKQMYLPEAHTDFIYAVIAEELGMFGCAIIWMCFLLLFARMFYWIIRACKQDQLFIACYIFGLMIWWGVAAGLSMAVNLGMVPTKGIALPMISYGGSNLLVNFCALAIFLRMTSQLQKEQACY